MSRVNGRVAGLCCKVGDCYLVLIGITNAICIVFDLAYFGYAKGHEIENALVCV